MVQELMDITRDARERALFLCQIQGGSGEMRCVLLKEEGEQWTLALRSQMRGAVQKQERLLSQSSEIERTFSDCMDAEFLIHKSQKGDPDALFDGSQYLAAIKANGNFNAFTIKDPDMKKNRAARLIRKFVRIYSAESS